MSDLLDLHTLSDPTDRHSLDELRAHLADSGDVQLVECQHEWMGSLIPKGLNPAVVCVWCGAVAPRARLASERSGGDGR